MLLIGMVDLTRLIKLIRIRLIYNPSIRTGVVTLGLLDYIVVHLGTTGVLDRWRGGTSVSDIAE